MGRELSYNLMHWIDYLNPSIGPYANVLYRVGKDSTINGDYRASFYSF